MLATLMANELQRSFTDAKVRAVCLLNITDVDFSIRRYPDTVGVL